MKQLIFLLIMAVVLVGIMPAQDAANPPGALALDVAMPGYGIHEVVIFPDRVSVDMLFELSAGFLASPTLYMIDVSTGQPQYYPLMKPIMDRTGMFIPPNLTGFHLRL